MHRETKNGYLVTTYFGLPELMETAVDYVKPDAARGKNVPSVFRNIGTGENLSWVGIEFGTWEDVRNSAQTKWEHGLKRIEEVRKELEQCDIPAPVNRKRKRRWSEDQGEVDVDRVMEGDSYCYNEVKRMNVSGSPNITLILDMGGNCNRSIDDLFWRAAAVLVLIEMLEDAGYSCELVAWSKVIGVFPYAQTENAINIIRLKEAGEVLDMSYLVNGTSAWALRAGVFGSCHSAGFTLSPAYGKYMTNNPPNESELESMGVDQSTTAFVMPGNIFDKRNAIAAAKDIIQQIGQGAVI